MYGGVSYGVVAYSEQDFTPIDTAEIEAFLNDVQAERCWLLELDAFSLVTSDAVSAAHSDHAHGEVGHSSDLGVLSGSVHTLRYSTNGYISKAADNPAYTYFDARLREETIDIDRYIADRNGLGGLARTVASIVVDNRDGELDELLRNYAIDGRQVRILVGRPTDERADFVPVFTGVVARPEITRSGMKLELSDGSAKLDRSINEDAYAGSGGLEGGADLKGKRKPVGYGPVFGISPPLVDAATLTYQVHNGPINDVPAVYDRGIALVKVGGAPAAGEYQVDVVLGTFKLGAMPAGQVTCDGELDASLSGYLARAPDIVLRILVQRAGLTSSEIDPSTFASLTGAVPGNASPRWAGTEPLSIRAVVGELLADVGCWGGFSRFGTFGVGQLAAPAGVPKATYTEEDIMDIERIALPAPVDPLVWRVEVGYKRNHTVQNDLAAAVSDAQRAFASEPMRVVSAQDSGAKTRHLLARELTDTGGAYAEEADALQEANRKHVLWGRRRDAFYARTRPAALLRDLGHVVSLQHPRLGLQNGALCRVLRHQVKGPEVTLSVIA